MAGNFFQTLIETCPAQPADPCLETETGRRLSYGELFDLAARLSAVLRSLGAAPGDRVMVQAAKSPEALGLYLACLRGGFVHMPLNTAYTRSELEYFASDAQPRVIVCDPQARPALAAIAAEHAPAARVETLAADGGGSLTEQARGAPADQRIAPVGAGQQAAMIYTSGTTGRPKGVMLTHENLRANALTLHRAWGFRAGDVLLHALPIFHVHGLFVASHCALLNGSLMHFLPRFTVAAVLERLPRSTVMMGVPTFYTRLLAEPAFDAGLCRPMRLFISGSAPLHEETFTEFEARTGHRILERYGLSETGMNTSNPLAGERVPGTVGPPLPGVDVRVCDEQDTPLPAGEVGMVQVKGPNVFAGYWGQPEQTAGELTADGFFRTGDLGRFDPAGYLTIVGRAKDMIISGGYNVYPKEVERVLDACPGVAESAVFGVPDPDLGEAVTAAVVARSPEDSLDVDAILAAARAELAGYKVPKRIWVREALPRNTMGKVQKARLRAEHGTR